jgi:hypothetical protein
MSVMRLDGLIDHDVQVKMGFGGAQGAIAERS